jgi:DNA-directed RNA polymerase specialized sigma24 family protein
VSERVTNRADAADIAQETLLIACAKLHTFRGRQIRGWLFAIADDLIVDYDRARTEVHLIAMDPAADDEKESALQIPAEAVVAEWDFRRRLNGWLRRCAQLLDPGQQVAVLLADIYDYCDRDSAAMLKMSVPSFKLLLHRSRANLRTFGAAAATAPVAVRRPGTGVVCHLDATELRSLRRTLVNGIRRALTVLVLMSDFIELDLLDLLCDM